MIKRITFFILIFLFVNITVFGYQNITGCTVLNSPNTEYRLNQNINCISGTECIGLPFGQFTNSTLDCQGFNITETGDCAYAINDGGNIHYKIKNCNIYNFQYGMFPGAKNSKFENINLYNQSSSSIRILGGYNNTFYNIKIANNLNGISMGNTVSNNTFDNIQIINTTYSMWFTNLNVLVNNTFKNSYLGNFSSIHNNNWENSPTNFIDNTYMVGTVPNPPCFDASNTVCETNPIYNSNSEFSQSNTFPFGSSLLSFILILSWFLFN